MATGEQDKQSEQNEQSAPQLEQLNAQLKAMKDQLSGVTKAKEEAEAKLRRQDETLLSDDYLEWLEQRSKSGKREESEGQEDEQQLDLDTLTGSQLAGHLSKKQAAELAKVKEEYEKSVISIRENMSKAIAYFDLELTKLRNPKLGEWLSEEGKQKRFIEIANENPSWNSSRVFKQMEAEELVREKEEEASRQEKKQEDDKIISEFESITPTTVAPKKLTKEQAAQLAYQRVFGNQKE